jgi:CheY-like chemotaxis protein
MASLVFFLQIPVATGGFGIAQLENQLATSRFNLFPKALTFKLLQSHVNCGTKIRHHFFLLKIEARMAGKLLCFDHQTDTMQAANNLHQAKPYRIVLADDDEDDREIFRLALNELNLPVDVVYKENGSQLIKYLVDETPDVIFLDLNMPLVNGFECLKIIRNNTVLQQIPVIILSTSSGTMDIDKCYQMGANYYIVKPFSHKDLATIINRLLQKELKKNIQPAKNEFLVTTTGL